MCEQIFVFMLVVFCCGVLILISTFSFVESHLLNGFFSNSFNVQSGCNFLFNR